ncbi:saccharopine dehydrogenase family protein [Phycisphaera mikurensis]|uniref:Putative dehydrogenase n=1 Tax=Phycisphaera mikurensis (strain NBRC 102666 / KCTC 22515 / FYK2301M01) TaxID=1142394 RepID=I0ICS2_PHYMF|nr:saccharopine dehydrogenase NADP-binding domain-containing protein [Phycisphaera mikurensis]MBB6443319.1 saccharopine dehydrogenase-like NADP-dependent oxidoreductase [Phycisphaera mikurensis]BAM03060.1 putative dehydrogenase [Phycisphaera mikurensis NBRC 102666]
MHHVLLLGAGKIGSAIARLLGETGDYDVLVADADAASLERLEGFANVATRTLDCGDADALAAAMEGRHSVISALSFRFNPAIARCARENGLSYFDLTEDVETTRAVREQAEGAAGGTVFLPQCGLAPGFVSIAAHELTKSFDALDTVRLRVGALPIFPSNQLRYNLTWSTDGLINEYGNPCEAVAGGKRIDVLPLEGLEHFSLDGVMYEAFNTSGGVGTLGETLAGQVRDLDYKTIRYRGHRDLIAFLMNDLRLNERREILKDILEHAVPMTPQDVVLIFCTATGQRDGHLVQVTDARKVYHGPFRGLDLSAIQLTTAASICAVLDLHATGKLPAGGGFVRQEQVPLADFLANRFGCCYATGRENVEEIAEPYVPQAS